MPSSKKRPGVPAAIRLASSEDAGLWERVEQQYDSVKSEALEKAEKKCPNKSLGKDLTKDQLMDLVAWKFAVGKPRPQLLGLLRSNTESLVQQCSEEAIRQAKQLDASDLTEPTGELNAQGKGALKETLEELTQLKGVGPATSTAVVCRIRPDLVSYMYDEVIDCFEAKRDYTFPVYFRTNSKCLQIAKVLGEGWTTHRVATVLWTAARVLAQGGDDLTKAIDESSNNSESQSKENQGDVKPRRKRKRTKP